MTESERAFKRQNQNSSPHCLPNTEHIFNEGLYKSAHEVIFQPCSLDGTKRQKMHAPCVAQCRPGRRGDLKPTLSKKAQSLLALCGKQANCCECQMTDRRKGLRSTRQARSLSCRHRRRMENRERSPIDFTIGKSIIFLLRFNPQMYFQFLKCRLLSK